MAVPAPSRVAPPHSWQRPLFWKMLGADVLLVGFTAVIYPGSTGRRLVAMIAGLLLASLVLNLVLTPPRSGDHARTLDLARRTVRRHEDERASIAGQLRDNIGQDLAALSLQLTAAIRGKHDPEVAETLDALQVAAARLTSDVRIVADEIYPGLLSEMGLSSALTALRRRAADRGRIDVRVQVTGTAFTVPLVVMRALLLVAEAAIENAERYAGVAAADLTLTFAAPTVSLEVSDAGAGFDIAAAEQQSTGIGLFRARELLAHAGGQMQIRSSPGSGTRVVASITLKEGMQT
jgi:signal transduction histidine kinase